jgi:hypothetical protein
MKKFLAIYLGTPATRERSGWDKMDEAKRNKLIEQGMKAWEDWMESHKAVIVEQGAPLGKTKRTDRAGVSDTKNNLTGYIVVQAESQDAAAKLFLNHPHFMIFPGDSVEIMECLPIPGQR